MFKALVLQVVNEYEFCKSLRSVLQVQVASERALLAEEKDRLRRLLQALDFAAELEIKNAVLEHALMGKFKRFNEKFEVFDT